MHLLFRSIGVDGGRFAFFSAGRRLDFPEPDPLMMRHIAKTGVHDRASRHVTSCARRMGSHTHTLDTGGFTLNKCGGATDMPVERGGPLRQRTSSVQIENGNRKLRRSR